MLTYRDINPFARKITPFYFIKRMSNSKSFSELVPTEIALTKYTINYFTNLIQKLNTYE